MKKTDLTFKGLKEFLPFFLCQSQTLTHIIPPLLLSIDFKRTELLLEYSYTREMMFKIKGNESKLEF